MRNAFVIARNDLRMLRRDPVVVITFIVAPLLTMGVTKRAAQAALNATGFPDANGAEQAVAGAAVLFAFFLVGYIGFGTYREHGWNTWMRLRASPTTPAEMVAGKAIVPISILGLQLVVLFAAGFLLFDLRVRGSFVGLVLVLLSYGGSLVAIGFALLAVCQSVMQLNALSNMSALLFGTLGGALVPVSTLPGWARFLAPATPTYWAMRGIRDVTLEHGGVADVVPSVVVLTALAAVAFGIAHRRFRVTDHKVWA